MRRSNACVWRKGVPSLQPLPGRSLYEQINLELKKLCSQEEAFTWLMSPQQRLGLRIPARMMAIGEGRAVLEALVSASTPP